MKISLENVESVRYKITDDISIELSIVDGDLVINTINKVSPEDEKKKMIKERFQEICGDKPSNRTIANKTREEWKDFVANCFNESEKKIQTIKDETRKTLADNENNILGKIHENFDEINEKAEKYAQNMRKEHYRQGGVTINRIGYLDNRITEHGTKSDFRVKDIEDMENKACATETENS